MTRKWQIEGCAPHDATNKGTKGLDKGSDGLAKPIDGAQLRAGPRGVDEDHTAGVNRCCDGSDAAEAEREDAQGSACVAGSNGRERDKQHEWSCQKNAQPDGRQDALQRSQHRWEAPDRPSDHDRP